MTTVRTPETVKPAEPALRSGSGSKDPGANP